MTDPDLTHAEDAPSPGGVAATLVVLLAAWIVAALVPPCWTLLGTTRPELIFGLKGVVVLVTGLVFFLLVFVGRGRQPTTEKEPEAWVCMHCLKPYVPGVHFCPRCAAPQTFYAATAQYERIYARAWILGKAAHHPSHWTHVVVLLLAGVAAVLPLVFTLLQFFETGGVFSPWGIDGGLEIASLIIGLPYLLLMAWIMARLAWLSVRNWRRRKRGEATPEIEYGSPPWWTKDVEWALPEVIYADDEEDGGAASPPPTPSAG